MLEKNNDILKNFASYKNEKSILKKQNIEKNHKDFISKSFDTESHIKNALSRHIC